MLTGAESWPAKVSGNFKITAALMSGNLKITAALMVGLVT